VCRCGCGVPALAAGSVRSGRHSPSSSKWKVEGMKTVSSNDATKIAYDQQGQGPALILVNGAMNTRSSGSNPALAAILAQHLTVYSFDRRGRGESGDTLPYAVAREIEDVEALIAASGGAASRGRSMRVLLTSTQSGS
jgi:hypothetical protein